MVGWALLHECLLEVGINGILINSYISGYTDNKYVVLVKENKMPEIL